MDVSSISQCCTTGMLQFPGTLFLMNQSWYGDSIPASRLCLRLYMQLSSVGLNSSIRSFHIFNIVSSNQRDCEYDSICSSR